MEKSAKISGKIEQQFGSHNEWEASVFEKLLVEKLEQNKKNWSLDGKIL